ncbi:beta-1 [Mactra antiquata]
MNWHKQSDALANEIKISPLRSELSVNNGFKNDLRPRISPGRDGQFLNKTSSKLYEQCVRKDKKNKCPSSCWKQENDNKGNNSDVININKDVDCGIDVIVEHCDLFKTINGYDNIKVTADEETFPIAFAIKVFNLPDQAEQLLRTIYRKHNVYCIHIDKRADDRTVDMFRKIGDCLENVKVLEDTLALVHASVTEVLAEMKCMETMRNSSVPWKYYINLSELDFPLKTNLEIVKILDAFDGLNDIESYDHPIFDKWRLENRFSVHKNSLIQDSVKQHFKYDLQFSKGHPFGMFSRNFVDFVFQDDVAAELITWLNETYSPAENLWATLVTLPWAPGGYPVSVRHMISSYMSRAMIVSGDVPRCHGVFESGTCLFSCSDIWWLQNRPEFFASKFDSRYDKQVLNCMESWLRQKALKSDSLAINWNFYHNLPHMKYHSRHKYSTATQAQRERIKKDWILKHLKVS